ncbi:MAG TPA: methyltransferase domain-containing protein [Pyrinomonadaceae bacterium]|jgi:2-polyprenyl-3-methyl-5-hydroxy-6-metoxy-1,4-benzoquinol methylase
MTISKTAYEAWHERLDVDAEADAPWHVLVKKHLDAGRDLAGRRVLEIGCGRGGFACWLAAQATRPAEVVAADFAETAVRKGEEYAARRGVEGVRWDVADIQAMAYPDASFDTVISCETVEHVPDPRLALRELARVVRPGGRLFLTTPNYFGPMGLLRGYMRLTGRRYTEEGQPINNFMLLPRVRAWVARAGLRVTRTDAVGHYLPMPGRPPVEMPALNSPRFLMRWFALHSLVVAEKQ